MSGKIKDRAEAFRALMNALAEEAATLSDEETEAEVRAEGKDPKETAEKTRAVLMSAYRRFRQRALHSAAQSYRNRVREIRKRRYTLPESPEERRRLLELVMRRPGMKSAFLTAQYRDFERLPDDDVESILKQLQELGVLDELTKGEKED